VSGTPRVGSPLTASPGLWNAPAGTLSYRYQWFADGVPVSGATAGTYVPVAADTGKRLSVVVAAERVGFLPGLAASAPTDVVRNTAYRVVRKPRIGGKARVGKELYYRPAKVTPRPKRDRLQWLRGGKPIKGATRRFYRLREKDLGKRITLQITWFGPGMTPLTARTHPTAKVKPAKRPRGS
jgi:hypothetical protein